MNGSSIPSIRRLTCMMDRWQHDGWCERWRQSSLFTTSDPSPGMRLQQAKWSRRRSPAGLRWYLVVMQNILVPERTAVNQEVCLRPVHPGCFAVVGLNHLITTDCRTLVPHRLISATGSSQAPRLASPHPSPKLSPWRAPDEASADCGWK